MAPRAYWKGYLKLSLVSCPIALYPASSGSERVSFNRINSKTGNRLKQQMVDAESGEPVDKEEVQGRYVRQPARHVCYGFLQSRDTKAIFMRYCWLSPQM